MSNDAYPTLFKWATLETNYPAGPKAWNGQPVMFIPSGDVHTPDTKPSAEVMNYIQNQLANNAATVLGATALAQVQNFGKATMASAISAANTFNAIAYDAVNDLWVIGANVGSTGAGGIILAARGDAIDPFAQPGGGALSEVALGVGGIVTCVLKDPTDKTTYYLAGVDSSGHAVAWRIDSVALTATSILVDSSHSWADVKLACLNGKLIVAVASGSSPANSYIRSSTDKGTTYGAPVGVPNVTSWFVATSPSQFIGIGLKATTPVVITSPDGLSFTAQPTGFSGLVPSGVSTPVGITWASDASGSAWFFGHTRSDTNKNQWLRSGDGNTWTAAGTVATANWSTNVSAGANLAAIGSLLVTFATDSTGLALRVLYSVDGAHTWYVAPVHSAFSGGTVSIAAGANRLLATVNGQVWLSQAQGISGLVAV